ncbi:MAG: hypothetical protein HQ521_02275 [Bacteroidetes bacterium]|nr:hypothetical protein [Bacteroidota bacterium]
MKKLKPIFLPHAHSYKLRRKGIIKAYQNLDSPTEANLYLSDAKGDTLISTNMGINVQRPSKNSIKWLIKEYNTKGKLPKWVGIEIDEEPTIDRNWKKYFTIKKSDNTVTLHKIK